MIWICHRRCQGVTHPTRYTASFAKLETEKMMCSPNRKLRKIIWTQSTLEVVLCGFRIKFGLCSHYFFLVSIETTNDWYIQLIFHMLCKKILYFDIQHALSEISMIWICHRHCLKIELFEWAGTHPSNKIYSQLCKTRNRKLMCDFNRKE